MSTESRLHLGVSIRRILQRRGGRRRFHRGTFILLPAFLYASWELIFIPDVVS